MQITQDNLLLTYLRDRVTKKIIIDEKYQARKGLK